MGPCQNCHWGHCVLLRGDHINRHFSGFRCPKQCFPGPEQWFTGFCTLGRSQAVYRLKRYGNTIKSGKPLNPVHPLTWNPIIPESRSYSLLTLRTFHYRVLHENCHFPGTPLPGNKPLSWPNHYSLSGLLAITVPSGFTGFSGFPGPNTLPIQA